MTQESERSGGGGQAPAPQGETQGSTAPDRAGELKSLFIQGLYAILFIIILLAALQLYFSIQEFISRWFSYEYIPLVNSLYYLVIIAGGIYLIFTYIRGR